MSEESNQLKVFLCHSSGDKPIVRDLYKELLAEGWIDPWLDTEKLIPGQNWKLEIPKAVQESNVIVVCCSNGSVSKEGYIQKELRFALDKALEMPDGTIFIIPIRLEECNIPETLSQWQWVDYFPQNRRNKAYERIIYSLKTRAKTLGIFADRPTTLKEEIEPEEMEPEEVKPIRSKTPQSFAKTSGGDKQPMQEHGKIKSETRYNLHAEEQILLNQAVEPSEIFTSEKVNFEQAKEKYRKAIRLMKPLAELNNLPSPPVNRAAYSDRMAWIMAHMAKLAYTPFEESDLELEQLEYSLQSGWFNLMKTFNKKGTQAFLAKNDQFAVLAFRGTQPTRWEDVRTDLRALKQKTIEGKVHKGFKEAFDDVRDEIFDIVDKSIGKDLPLYVTGHSLGAALATVATQELEEKYNDLIAACYTFGSPRVGDGKYERSIKAPFYRIVNTTDIVTLIPFIFGTFVHVGDARYLSRRKVDGVYWVYRGIPFLRRSLESIIETILPIFSLHNPLWPWISAHNMDIYIEKLESYAMARNVKIA